MIPDTSNSIEQKSFLRGRQKFEIRPDAEIEITFDRLTVHRKFKFPLWHLNPSPERLKFTQTGSLVGAIIFGACSAGVIAGMIGSHDWGLTAALGFPLFLFGCLFCICLWRFRTQSVNAMVYYFRNGDGQLHIWFEKPNPKTFQSFCEALTKHAEKAWQERPSDPSAQSLAGEITALKKLKDTGVLSDAEFERAKTKLLEQVEQRRIGFT